MRAVALAVVLVAACDARPSSPSPPAGATGGAVTTQAAPIPSPPRPRPPELAQLTLKVLGMT